MAYKFHPISARYWTDERVQNWSNDAQLLGLYLLTCQHRLSEGLFRIPRQYILADLKWSAERLQEPFAQLLSDGFMEYDENVSVVLLLNALKYRQPENPNQITAALRAISELPSTPLLARLVTVAEQFAVKLAKPLAELLAERYAQSPTPSPTPTPTLKTEDKSIKSLSTDKPLTERKATPRTGKKEPDAFNQAALPLVKKLDAWRKTQDLPGISDWATAVRITASALRGDKTSSPISAEDADAALTWAMESDYWRGKLKAKGMLLLRDIWGDWTERKNGGPARKGQYQDHTEGGPRFLPNTGFKRRVVK